MKERKNPSTAHPESQAKKSKRIGAKESQVRIAELAIRQFTEDPSTLWSSLPELARAIELHLQSTSRAHKRVPVYEDYLTEHERQFRSSSLSRLVERYKESGTLQPDEAVKAFEEAAALKVSAEPHKGTLLEIAQRVLGISLSSEKPGKVTFLRGKPVHHTFEFIRGLTLSLTWDGKLITMETKPEELAFRAKALSLVGLGADSCSDVAKNHDAYLGALLDER